MRKKIFCLLMVLAMVMTTVPAAAFASEVEQMGGAPAETCEVTVNFDISSLGTDEALSELEFNKIPSGTVTVPKGTTLEDALDKLDQESAELTFTKANGMLTAVNHVTGKTEDNSFDTMLQNFGVEQVPAAFQYAGWMYSGEELPGMGINSDTIEKDTVVNFRYTLYFGAAGGGEWKNYDWEFVDAYQMLKDKVAVANGLDMSGYTPEEQAKVTEAKDAANTLLTSIENDSQGIWALYIATKTTALWGPNSVTDQLQKSLKDLTNAIDKVLSPTEIQVTGTTSGGRELTFNYKETVNLGESIQLNAKVLPEGANQEVTFELLFGGGVSVSEKGVVTATEKCSMAMIQVKSKEVPSLTKSLKIEFKEAPVVDHSARIETIMGNIAKSYIENSGEWQVIEMAAYLKYKPDTAHKTSDKEKQNFINKAIKTISTSTSDTELDKAILGLRGLNGDLEKLYAVNSNTAINAIDKLSVVKHNSSAWSAPYTMAAYNQGIQNKEKEDALIAEVLKAQNNEGAWDEFGTIDTTANVIAGLAFYQDRQEVKAAIDKGIEYLSSKQENNGAYNDNWNGVNSNSTSMVIVALAAAGVNPDTDARFIKNGNSALDGLMSFALDNNSGFGHTDKSKLVEGSTEQAFRALIAASNIMEDGKAYNVYDFSTNPKEPIRATGEGNVDKPTAPEGDNITVTMSVKADTGYWMNNATVSIPGKNAKVYHAFVKGCQEAGITYTGAESGYVRSMTKNGRTLSEFDNGSNSGWMYKVNGELPTVGLTEKDIKNGDNIVWFYTNDWKNEPGAFVPEENKDVATTGPAGSAVTTTPTEVTVVGDTAKVTVKHENITEAIKQAKENKSKEIILDVKAVDIKKATKIEAELDASVIRQLAKNTTTSLAIKSPIGKAEIGKELLAEIASKAKGSKVIFEVTQNADKKLELTVKSGTEVIYTSVQEPEKDKTEEIKQIKEQLKTLKPTARSVKTAKKNVIVRVNLSKTQKEMIENIEAAGYDVKYHFYRSTKKGSKYESKLKSEGTRYVNTVGKKGRTYYYKARVQVYDENGKLIAKTTLKNCKYAARVWTK